jgi:hypothetical protein
MFIVIYRPHNAMICETEYYGPFKNWASAYSKLSALPAIGIHHPEGDTPNAGVKFVQELLDINSAVTQNRIDHERDVAVFDKGARCGSNETANGPRWLARYLVDRDAHWAEYAK